MIETAAKRAAREAGSALGRSIAAKLIPAKPATSAPKTSLGPGPWLSSVVVLMAVFGVIRGEAILIIGLWAAVARLAEK